MKRFVFLLAIILCGRVLASYDASDDNLFGISGNGEMIHLNYGSTKKEIIYAANQYKNVQDKVFYSDDENPNYGICQYQEDRSISCIDIKTGTVHLKYTLETISTSSPGYREALRAYKALYGKGFKRPNKGLDAYVCSMGCERGFSKVLIPNPSCNTEADGC